MNSIYFDNAATTPVADEVLDAMIPYLKTNFGNSSSIHSFGKSAKVLIEDTRDLISQIIGSKPNFPNYRVKTKRNIFYKWRNGI